MDTKRKLFSYLPPSSRGGKIIQSFIEENLDVKQMLQCLKYLNELETSGHTPTIANIEFDASGHLFIQATSGMTFFYK